MRTPLLEEIEDFTMTRTAHPSMLTRRVEGRFLQLATKCARHIVEIGTFTGYSAVAMAEVLPDDGEILTIEHNRDYAKIAQDFFDRSPNGFKITLRMGEALDILKSFPDEKTDLVFKLMPINKTIVTTTENQCGLYDMAA